MSVLARRHPRRHRDHFLIEEFARPARAGAMPPADPFGLDELCSHHAGPHQPIVLEDAVVCFHCAKIFWSER